MTSLEEQHNVDRNIRICTCWFFGIAVLSVANTLLLLYWGTTFIIGFGFIAVTTAFAEVQGVTATGLIIAVTVVCTGIYLVLGVFGRRRNKWAFTTGLVVYATDGLFLLLVQDWYSIAFHCLSLFFIYIGWQAADRYNQLHSR